MHYADLSAYEHDEDAPDLGRAKNVGWLAAAEPFATSAPVPGLLDALAAYCSVAVSGFRGTHACELCSEREPRVAFDGRLFVLGSAEIRVLGKELVFAAPNLVHHYVAVHHYRPPDVFVEAALSGPRPPSAEYFRRLDALGCHWERARASSVQVDWERWARGAKTEAADRRSGAAERVQHLTASWSQHLSHERDFDGFVGEVIRLVSNGDKVSMLLGSGPEIHLHVGTRPATLTDADAEAKLRAVCERLASLFLGGGRTPPALGKLSGGVELRGARCRALLTYVTATRGAKTQFALYPAIDPSSDA